MTVNLEPSTTALLEASRDDQDTLQLAVKDRIFGFHAQQAVEKPLKVLISAHGLKFEYTHDLERLLERVADLKENAPVSVAFASQLTMFAGLWRYETSPNYDEDQRGAVIDSVAQLRAFVLSRLPLLQPGGSWPSE